MDGPPTPAITDIDGVSGQLLGVPVCTRVRSSRPQPPAILPSYAARGRAAQYAGHLVEAGLLGDAKEYLAASGALASKAKQDARAASALTFRVDLVVEAGAELNARVAAAVAADGGRAARSGASRTVLNRVGGFIDNSIMKLLGAESDTAALPARQQHGSINDLAGMRGASGALAGPPPPAGRPPLSRASEGPRSVGPGSHGSRATSTPAPAFGVHRHNQSAPMLPALAHGAPLSGSPSAGAPVTDDTSGPSSNGPGRGVRGLLTGLASALTGTHVGTVMAGCSIAREYCNRKCANTDRFGGQCAAIRLHQRKQCSGHARRRRCVQAAAVRACEPYQSRRAGRARLANRRHAPVARGAWCASKWRMAPIARWRRRVY